LSQDGATIAPRRRRRPKHERHAEIKLAAARIFHERGYSATSVQDVADAVGILKGSMYYYMKTKEDLLLEVVQTVHERALEQLESWKAVKGDVFDRLRAFIEGQAIFNMENIVEIGVFLHEFRQLSPQRKQEIVAKRDYLEQYVRELIREGQATGAFRPDLDPKLTAMAIFGVVNWTYQWYQPDGPDAPEKIARQWADFILSGLAADKPARRPKPVTGKAATG
jgi:AcrR family transcriptional regulator